MVTQSNQPAITGRQSAENVIRGNVGVTRSSKHARSEYDCWKLLFSKDILIEIVWSTNEKITKFRNEVDHLHTNTLFADTCGHPIYGATMSKCRFKFLKSKISFDEEETRQER